MTAETAKQGFSAACQKSPSHHSPLPQSRGEGKRGMCEAKLAVLLVFLAVFLNHLLCSFKYGFPVNTLFLRLFHIVRKDRLHGFFELGGFLIRKFYELMAQFEAELAA
jgi:hypothetical protein